MEFIKEIEKIFNLNERIYEFSGSRIKQYTKILVDISNKEPNEIQKTIEICKECNVYLTMQNYEIGLQFPDF